LQIYELLGMAGEATEPSGWVAAYESGLVAFRARDFEGAIECFQQAIALRSGDEASSVMIERCKQLREAPADEGWDDTTVARVK
jgi:adenylate cyclase